MTCASVASQTSSNILYIELMPLPSHSSNKVVGEVGEQQGFAEQVLQGICQNGHRNEDGSSKRWVGKCKIDGVSCLHLNCATDVSTTVPPSEFQNSLTKALASKIYRSSRLKGFRVQVADVTWVMATDDADDSTAWLEELINYNRKAIAYVIAFLLAIYRTVCFVKKHASIIKNPHCSSPFFLTICQLAGQVIHSFGFSYCTRPAP